VERLLAAGALRAYRDGRRVLVPADDLRRHVAERTARASHAPAAPRGRALPPGARLWDAP